jgi:TolA-binding protein
MSERHSTVLKLAATASVILVALLANATAQQVKRPVDEHPIRITRELPESQTIPPEWLARMGKQEEQLSEISRRLDAIERSIRDMQGDIKELMATNYVVNFLISIAKLLVPGLVITAFGIWFARYLGSRRATGASTP